MSELDEQMIELTIEALTGTVYDLCVSPFETILGIKMKIQRLEGIPVYQQQLVHGNTELHDEFCLEEYSIGSGAQLKLLLAMRGGPIHAHRVQLEDPTLLDIAEVLEAGPGDYDHKYTVMLLRDDDTLEVADFVQVVADESPGHVSPLPQTTSADQDNTAVALSQVTRSKMQDLMDRLRNRKQQATTATAKLSGSQLHRRGTAKVLILDSRSSSRLLRSSVPSPLTPHSRATPGNSRTPPTAQRKLVFPAGDAGTHTDGSRAGSSEDECSHTRHHKAAGLDEGGQSQQGHHSPLQHQQPHRHQGSERHQNLAYMYPHKQSDSRQHRHWRRRRRLHRPSCLQEKAPPTHFKAPPTVPHSHPDVSDLTKGLSQLGLKEERDKWSERDRGRARATADLLPHLPSAYNSSQSTSCTQPLHRQRSSVPQLPAISVGHAPCLTGGGRGKGRPHCMRCGKKTGLASTYTCRCGGVFCSLHRYAETHDCSFDYKTRGKDMIARGNPLVVATKLPKI